FLDDGLKSPKYFLQRTDPSSIISFSTIEEDGDGNLWAGSFGKGLFFKGQTDTTFQVFTGFSPGHTLPSDLVIYAIRADGKGKIWIGTYSNGLYLVDTKNQTIQVFKTDKRKPFSYAHNDVLCLQKDQKGGIWIGTDGGGISYYHSALANFSIYSANNIPDTISIEQVRSIVMDKQGKIWAGTSEKGLFCHDQKNGTFRQLAFEPYKKGITNPNRIVSLLCDDEGDLWVGTQTNGLLILDPKNGKIKYWFHPGASGLRNIPDPTIWCMTPYHDRQILLGTRNNGLLVIDKRKGLFANYNQAKSENRLAGFDNVRAITTVDDSTFIVGYERKGIQLFNSRTKSFYDLPGQPAREPSKGEIILKSIFYRFPFILIGTQGSGLIVYDMRSGRRYPVTSAHGLPNNTIYGILEDQARHLWLSTNKGICRLDLPTDPSSIHPADFDIYNVQDGLQSNEFNTGAWYRDKNGTLYYGGVKGLNYFNPAHFIKSSQDVPVVITQVNVKNNPYTSDTVI
ncbi:MAG: hypothetical protein EOO01_28395, partial [Chitinophagaceae bacterium]